MITFVDVYHPDGKPKHDAMAFLFELISQRMTEPEVNISATMPTWEEHRAFCQRLPYRYWYLIANEAAERVGYVCATRRNEVGIVLLKTHRGKGYGLAAVRMLMEKHKPLPPVPSERRGRWIANVGPGNEHSKHLFGTKLGGRLIQVTYEL